MRKIWLVILGIVAIGAIVLVAFNVMAPIVIKKGKVSFEVYSQSPPMTVPTWMFCSDSRYAPDIEWSPADLSFLFMTTITNDTPINVGWYVKATVYYKANESSIAQSFASKFIPMSGWTEVHQTDLPNVMIYKASSSIVTDLSGLYYVVFQLMYNMTLMDSDQTATLEVVL